MPSLYVSVQFRNSNFLLCDAFGDLSELDYVVKIPSLDSVDIWYIRGDQEGQHVLIKDCQLVLI